MAGMASPFEMVKTFLGTERKKYSHKVDDKAPEYIQIMMAEGSPPVEIKHDRKATWNQFRDEVDRIAKKPEFNGASHGKILEHLVKWALEKQPSGTQAKSNRKRGVDDVVVAAPTPLVSLSGGSGQHELSGVLALTDANLKRMCEAVVATTVQQVMNQQRSPNRLALQDSSMEDVKQLAATQMIEKNRAEVLAEASKQFREADINRDEIMTKAVGQMIEDDKEKVLAAAAQQFRGDDGNHDEILAKAAEQMREGDTEKVLAEAAKQFRDARIYRCQIMKKAAGQMIEGDKEKVLAEAAKQFREAHINRDEIMTIAVGQMIENDKKKVLEEAARMIIEDGDDYDEIMAKAVELMRNDSDEHDEVLGKAAEQFRAERDDDDEEIMAKAVEQMLKEDRNEVLQKAAENIKLGLGDQDRFIEKMDEDSDGTDEEENVISLANAVKARRKRRRHS